MRAHAEDSADPSNRVEMYTSHFIPSVELKGSRADKLQKLDTLIACLERLRKSLAGEPPGIHKRSQNRHERLNHLLIVGMVVLGLFAIAATLGLLPLQGGWPR